MYTRNANLIQLAQDQHSVFTHAQARNLGFTRKMIRTRCDTGQWIVLQPGLYRLGGATFHLLPRLSAALLTLPKAVASHESAAFLHDIELPVPTASVVTTSGASSRSNFATVHRYDGLHADDVTKRSGLRVTTVALTLFHLSTVVSERQLGRLVDHALHRRLTCLPDLDALADYWTRIGRPRRMAMRRILARRSDGHVPPQSALESAFVELVARHRLPAPTRQFEAPWLADQKGRVDFAYLDARLVIEVDGRAWHTREEDFARDRARDRKAQLAGWRVLRYTWAEVTRRSAQVVEELRRALSHNAAA